MREVGRIDRAAATIFSDFLVVNGIENELETSSDGLTAIWVLREDKVKGSRELFSRFRDSPGDSAWKDAATKARELREQTAAVETKREANIRTPAADWRQGRHAWLTVALIAGSVAVSLLCGFGKNAEELARFSINGFPADAQRPDELFHDILQGQLWRLVTPIFIHFSPMHLLGNMMGLMLFGQMIEIRQGRTTLAVMVTVMAIVSDCCQYLAAGPLFGGMSGVLYGLFGYVWLRSLLERGGGYYVSRTNVVLMIAWFFLCTTGEVGPIANIAHGSGLVLGAAWGALSVRSVRQRLLGIFGLFGR